MLKKISLFVFGMTGAVAAFWFYQYVSGVRPGTGGRVKGPVLSTSTAPGGTLIKERGADSKLKYVIRASNSPEPLLQNGVPVPGQYIFTKPEATFYGDNGSIVELQSEKGKFAFEPQPKSNTGMGFSGMTGKIKQLIRSGELSDHVRMRITRPARGLNDRLAGITYVYFDGPVLFDEVLGTLTSPAGVHVRSDAIAFDGSDFRMGLNIDGKDFQDQFQSLHIEKGDQIVVRNIGDELDAITNKSQKTATKPGTAKGTVAQTKSATGGQVASAPATKPGLPPTYVLTLADKVHVQLKHKEVKVNKDSKDNKENSDNKEPVVPPDYSLTGDHLALYFPATKEKDPNAPLDPAATAATTTAPIVASSEPAPDSAQDVELAAPSIPLEFGPVAPAGPNDATIAWAGPLDLRMTQDNEPHMAADDVQLEATGTSENPVVLDAPARKDQTTADTIHAVAGRLFYHDAEHLALLEPGNLPQVTASLNGKGEAKCDRIEIVEDKDKRQTVRLTGPGVLVQNTAAGDRNIRWQKLMTIESLPDAEGNNSEPRHIAFDGAHLRIPQEHSIVTMDADQLDILLAATKKKPADKNDTKSSDPPLEHLLATGNVSFKSLKRYDMDRKGKPIALADQKDKGEQSGLNGADRLELITTPGENGPELSQMLADASDGKISAWNYTDRPTKDDAKTPETATQPKPPKYPDRREDSISAAKLVADLKPKAKTSETPGDFNVDISHFFAKDGVTIVQKPAWSSHSPAVLITAYAIDSTQVPDKDKPASASQDNLPNMSATFTAADDPNSSVHLAFGNNTIDARQVIYDAVSQIFTVPVAGTANFEKRDAADPKKTRMIHITWHKSFTFDNGTSGPPRAVFIGEPEATVPTDNPKLADLGKMTCYDVPTKDQSPSLPHSLGMMTVNFKRVPVAETAPATRIATMASATQTAAAQNRFDLEFDSLDAVGSVDAHGAMLGDNDINLANMSISASVGPDGKPGQLHYHNDTHNFEIPGPGAMVIDLHEPPKADKKKDPDAPDSNGRHIFGWQKQFTFEAQKDKDGKPDNTNLATFEGKVIYNFTPEKRFAFMEHVDALNPVSAGTAKPGNKDAPPEPLTLETERLTALFIPADKPKATATSTAAKTQTKNAPSPISLEGMGDLQPKTVHAYDGAKLTIGPPRSPSFSAAGRDLDFDAKNNIAIMTGDAQDPVFITEGTRDSFSVSKATIHLNEQNAQKTFEFRDVRGNLSIKGFGE